MTDLATQRAYWNADVRRVSLAILRQHREGRDAGEFIAYAIADAQRHLPLGRGLDDNRPGNWEAAALEPFLRFADAMNQTERTL